MKKITIYTTKTCPFCDAAKELLHKKELDFEEINITGNRALHSKMTARANGRTSVPQIFFNEEHIGGYDDISALETQGTLDTLLQDA